MKKVTIMLLLLTIGLTTTISVDAQQYKPKSLIKKQLKENPPRDTVEKDTTWADREVVFDLEKLSRLASVAAYSQKNARLNGLVVLEVTVSSTGVPTGLTNRDASAPVLVPIAMDAVKQYAKRYNLRPAIKDKKHVEQSGIMLPIVFDMSIFDEKPEGK